MARLDRSCAAKTNTRHDYFNLALNGQEKIPKGKGKAGKGHKTTLLEKVLFIKNDKKRL